MGTLREEPWEPWEPLLGNLGTFTWEPGNLYLGPWEPLLGNLYLGTFTWNLGTLGEWVLELLRSAPKPLLWLKTPTAELGKNLGIAKNLGLKHLKNLGSFQQQTWGLNPSILRGFAEKKHQPFYGDMLGGTKIYTLW